MPKHMAAVIKEHIEEILKEQNVNYTIEITEPIITDQISRGTKKIAGHTYIPKAVIRLMLNGNINDDENGLDIYEARSDENGNFVFDNLNFDQLDTTGKYYIAFDIKYGRYDGDLYKDPGLRWYKIR